MRTRVLGSLALLALAACGHGEGNATDAPPRDIAAWCSLGGARLGLEPGVVDAGTSCEAVAATLSQYLQAYETDWHAVPALREWTIRIVADRPTQGAQPGNFFAGETFWGNRTIDIYQGSLNVLPHEAHHVALGPSSDTHSGWCPFGDWEAREGILEELSYLGCPARR